MDQSLNCRFLQSPKKLTVNSKTEVRKPWCLFEGNKGNKKNNSIVAKRENTRPCKKWMPSDTVYGRNPFRTTLKPWDTISCWYLQEKSTHSRISGVVRQLRNHQHVLPGIYSLTRRHLGLRVQGNAHIARPVSVSESPKMQSRHKVNSHCGKASFSLLLFLTLSTALRTQLAVLIRLERTKDDVETVAKRASHSLP